LPVRLINIGWDKVRSSEYRWNGLQRGGGYAIFQYTLSGKGAIRYGDKLYTLTKDTAFLVTIPGDHEYYLPDDSEEWEFLYVVINGRDALNHCASLSEKLGPVLSVKEAQSPLQSLSKLYADIYRNPQLDKYTISSQLYELLMELHRIADGQEGTRAGDDLPQSIKDAIRLMKRQFAQSLSTDDMAAAAGLTKYHFCRHFQKKTGLSPNQYLRKIRVEQAAWLLRHTNKTVEVIANETGFEYANYFIKVFRSFVGATPMEYRLGKQVEPVYFLRIEL
jgi:AraC-like DNA-binding protein